MAADPLSLPWRTGRHVPRRIYAQGGDWASREDRMVGVMDTPELAAEAVTGHNERLAVNPAVGLANAVLREALSGTGTKKRPTLR